MRHGRRSVQLWIDLWRRGAIWFDHHRAFGLLRQEVSATRTFFDPWDLLNMWKVSSLEHIWGQGKHEEFHLSHICFDQEGLASHVRHRPSWDSHRLARRFQNMRGYVPLRRGPKGTNGTWLLFDGFSKWLSIYWTSWGPRVWSLKNLHFLPFDHKWAPFFSALMLRTELFVGLEDTTCFTGG